MINCLFVCSCGDLEHQFVIRKFDDEPEVYLCIHLAPLPFVERLKYALRYIFGKRSKYGAFGEIILSKAQCLRLSHLLNDMED